MQFQMLMIFIVLFLFIYPASFFFNLINFFAEETRIFHELCLLRLNTQSPWDASRQALVCARSFPKEGFYQTTLSLGLVHCLVISGLHWHFLKRVTHRLWSKSLCLQILLAAIFLTMTQFTAPLTRVALSQTLSYPKFRILNSSHRTLVSSLVCLVLQPEWIVSLSFLLSWLACSILDLQLSSPWKTATAIYLASIPLLGGMQLASPLSLLVSPIIGLVLAPLLLTISWVSFVFPATSELSNSIFEFTSLVMKTLSSSMRPFSPELPVYKPWLAGYVCAFNLVGLSLKTYNIRKQASPKLQSSPII